MKDTITNLAMIGLACSFVYITAQIAMDKMEKQQERYKHCIAADRQWVRGSCVR